MATSNQLQPKPYRFYSTYIFEDRDEVVFDAFSVGECRFVCSGNILRDVAALESMARYWRAHLELEARAELEWNERFQTFIYARGKKVPVDHLCAEVNGVKIRLDFTGFGMVLNVSNRHRWTLARRQYKALRLFASAVRQAALSAK